MTDEERVRLRETMVAARTRHLEMMRTNVMMVAEIIDKIEDAPEEERLRYITAALKGLVLLAGQTEERIGKIMILLEKITEKQKDTK